MDSTLKTEIYQNYSNPAWVHENADTLFELVSLAFPNPELKTEAIEILLLIFPYLLDHPELKQWGEMITSSVHRVNTIEPSGLLEGQPTFIIGDIFVLCSQEVPKPLPSITPYRKRHRRPRHRLNGRHFAESYLALFMVLFSYHPDHFTQSHVHAALDLVQAINLPYYYYKLYQSLAMVYIKWGSLQTASDYAHEALIYWNKQDQIRHVVVLEQAISAYIMGLTIRGNTRVAMSYFKESEAAFNALGYGQQQAVVLTEMGGVWIKDEAYTEAIEVLVSALDKLALYNRPRHRATAHHHIGLAYASQDQYDLARQHLDSAMHIWTELNEPQQQAYVDCGLVYLDIQMGKPDVAVDRLQVLLDEHFTEPNWIHFRERILVPLLDTIKKQELVPSLVPIL